MTETVPSAAPIDLSKLPPRAIGAAVSKLVAASIGDICMVFARSPAHKHYTFADIEWMVLPAVLTGQFHVAEVQHKEHGARAPVAVVLWASVSDETDARLRADPGQRIRLRPDEWKSGNHMWIVDVAGDAAAIAGALYRLAETELKRTPVRVRTAGSDGRPHVSELSVEIERTRSAAGSRQ